MKKYFTKLCARCQKVTIPKGRQIYCGSYRRKAGCSWIVYKERSKRFQQAHPDYWKQQEKWRWRVGFYKRPKVIESRRKRQREAYRKSKLKEVSPK